MQTRRNCLYGSGAIMATNVLSAVDSVKVFVVYMNYYGVYRVKPFRKTS